MEWLLILKENLLPIISILIGATGLYVGFIRDRRNLNSKRLSWSHRRIAIIRKPDFKELKITYSGNRVNSLFITRVLLINEGRDIIEDKDVIDDHKMFLRKVDDSSTIFETEVLYCSRNAIGLEIMNYRDGSEFHFKYLNPGDGFIVNIIHDGGSEIDKLFEIEVEVKGISNITPIKPVNQYRVLRFILSVLIIIGIGFLLMILAAENIFNKLQTENDTLKGLVGILVLITPFIISIYLNSIFEKRITNFLLTLQGEEKNKLLKIFNS